MLNFNVDGAAQGKPCPPSIGGALLDNKGETFSKSIVVKDYNEVEVSAILVAKRPFKKEKRKKRTMLGKKDKKGPFYESLMMETGKRPI